MIEQTQASERSPFTLVPYPRLSVVITLAFCMYVLIWYLQFGERVPLFAAIRLELLWGSMLIVLSVSVGTRLDTPLTKWIAVYIFFLVAQIPLSHDFQASWDTFYDRILKFAFMGYFITTYVRNPRDLALFLGAFLLACMKMGQEGFTGTITGSMIWQNQGIMRLHGSTPLYGHPNSFSGMAVGTLPFIYYLFPIVKWHYKVLLTILAVFSGTIIIFTGSRTGYVAVFAFLTFIFLTSKRKSRFILIGIPVIVIGLSSVPEQYKGRFHSIFTQEEKEGNSAETRIQILKDAWEVFRRYPLGVGIRAFPKVRIKMFNRFQDTHNLYLEVATNLGIQGFIAFFSFVIYMLWLLNTLYRTLQQQISSSRSSLAAVPAILDPDFGQSANSHLLHLRLFAATARATFIFVICRLALGLFGMDLYEIYWWFAAGLTMALYNLNMTATVRSQEIQDYAREYSAEDNDG